MQHLTVACQQEGVERLQMTAERYDGSHSMRKNLLLVIGAKSALNARVRSLLMGNYAS